MELGDWRRAVFLDFEAVPDASGRFFPVEIGVSVAGGATQSRFIRPRPEWLPGKPAWDGQARNLSLAMDGVPADEIRDWALRALAGRPVVSDAVFVDQALLDRLVDSPGHGLRFVEFFAEVEGLRREAGVSASAFNSMIADIDSDRGPAHTAGEDARVRAELVWRLLGYARTLGG